jgi:hypothetical protein
MFMTPATFRPLQDDMRYSSRLTVIRQPLLSPGTSDEFNLLHRHQPTKKARNTVITHTAKPEKAGQPMASAEYIRPATVGQSPFSQVKTRFAATPATTTRWTP